MRKTFRILALSSMLILGFQNTNADCALRNGQDANGSCSSYNHNGSTHYRCNLGYWFWGDCNVAASATPKTQS